MPASPARLAANRANAQKSTGPRTHEGKARSAQNAVQHGAYASDATLATLPDSPYAATLARYMALFAPATPLETIYVERAAALDARLQLVRTALDALLSLNERRALSDCLQEQYNIDRPAAYLPAQPHWSAALRRYDGNAETYDRDPDPILDPDLDACSLAYTLTSPRGLALLSHESALDRRLHAALTALDRLQRTGRRAQPPRPVTPASCAPAPALVCAEQPAPAPTSAEPPTTPSPTLRVVAPAPAGPGFVTPEAPSAQGQPAAQATEPPHAHPQASSVRPPYLHASVVNVSMRVPEERPAAPAAITAPDVPPSTRPQPSPAPLGGTARAHEMDDPPGFSRNVPCHDLLRSGRISDESQAPTESAASNPPSERNKANEPPCAPHLMPM